MKTLYSSTFLSIIIVFLAFLGYNGQSVVLSENAPEHLFSYIETPLPKAPGEEPVELPITVDVFYSFGCPGCSDFGLNTIPALQKKYLEDKDIDLKFHIAPVQDDAGAYYSAVAVKCAAEYGKYWEMHKKLNETSDPLGQREADLLGQELGLPVSGFRNCLKSGKYDEDIGKVMDYAGQKGITKLPTILIGDYRLYGDQPIENIVKVIDEIKDYKITKLQD
jgi:protein-disulfide isomerase